MVPSTIHCSVKPHLPLFQRHDFGSLHEYDVKYRTLVQTTKDNEELFLEQQNQQVKKAIQTGKDKREIRKLKNRLSAIRSRARKEAELAINDTKIKSLEAQVQMYASLVTRLQHKNTKLCNKSENRPFPKNHPAPKSNPRGAQDPTHSPNNGNNHSGDGSFVPTDVSPVFSFSLSPSCAPVSTSSSSPRTVSSLGHIHNNSSTPATNQTSIDLEHSSRRSSSHIF